MKCALCGCGRLRDRLLNGAPVWPFLHHVQWIPVEIGRCAGWHDVEMAQTSAGRSLYPTWVRFVSSKGVSYSDEAAICLACFRACGREWTAIARAAAETDSVDTRCLSEIMGEMFEIRVSTYPLQTDEDIPNGSFVQGCGLEVVRGILLDVHPIRSSLFYGGRGLDIPIGIRIETRHPQWSRRFWFRRGGQEEWLLITPHSPPL